MKVVVYPDRRSYFSMYCTIYCTGMDTGGLCYIETKDNYLQLLQVTFCL